MNCWDFSRWSRVKFPGGSATLQLAIQLEPEKTAYLFSLAQLQLRMHNLEAARITLQPLLAAPAWMRNSASRPRK